MSLFVVFCRYCRELNFRQWRHFRQYNARPVSFCGYVPPALSGGISNKTASRALRAVSRLPP